MAPETRSPAPAVAAGNGAHPSTFPGNPDGAEHMLGDDPRPVFQQISDLLWSGYSGFWLAKLLNRQFPAAALADVYLACGDVMATVHGQFILAVIDKQIAEKEAAQLRAELAKLKGRR
jgi:hypothetical protein